MFTGTEVCGAFFRIKGHSNATQSQHADVPQPKTWTEEMNQAGTQTPQLDNNAQ